MAIQLPLSPNTTCDIYIGVNAPPAAPNVAGVKIFLTADYEQRLETGESEGITVRYTHIALMPWDTDIRDGFADWSLPGNPNHLYVPDKNGTQFRIKFVERKARGTPLDHKKVYLDRGRPTWPTSNL